MGAEASGCEMGGRGIAEPDSAEREGVDATPSRHGIVAPSSISARPTRLICYGIFLNLLARLRRS